jgi:uncharacterized membrane protein
MTASILSLAGAAFAAFALAGFRKGQVVGGSQMFSRKREAPLFWIAMTVNTLLAITCIGIAAKMVIN